MSNDDMYRDAHGFKYLVRSDGNGLFLISWVIFFVAVVCAFLWIAMPVTESYSDRIDLGRVQLKNNFLMASCGFFSIWFMTLMSAFIIRAIYFLPGETMKPSSETLAIQERNRIWEELQAAQPVAEE